MIFLITMGSEMKCNGSFEHVEHMLLCFSISKNLGWQLIALLCLCRGSKASLTHSNEGAVRRSIIISFHLVSDGVHFPVTGECTALLR